MLAENRAELELASDGVRMTRFLCARRDLVFDALVEPRHLTRWSGPTGFTPTVCEVELWPGGVHRAVMRAPDGKELTLSGIYGEISRPERLTYTERFHIQPHSSHEHAVGFTLDERDGGTLLVVTERLQATDGRRAAMKVGAWEANLRSLDRLAELVESMSPGNVQDDLDRAWELMPFECEDRVPPRASGTYPTLRSAALERFAALFIERS
jgi:uncharacterized protein YndB with AHSA1/START domain